ncbi:hypothetical protein F511_22802 [Dorcoceras hygrometricum]|uniref:Uncharacterized protein n=1 Tax=Dorcoceras hygrometricum TaxID=472368 RepID=A0A2Z7C8R9_9LAMI|nr:hypothetical protein F511_22802 [Dorcoceras hygrometricum]
MSRSLKESVIGAGRKSLPGHSPNGSLRNFNEDDNLDLFSKTRRSFSVTSAHHPDVTLKLGRLSIGSAKQGKSGLDDMLSADGGKHDYDWLLTPPGTPLVPSSGGNESQPGLLAPRSSQLVRSISTTKASRLSVSQSESNHAAKPTRSRSVTRSSGSSSQHNPYSSKSTSILNSSSASVSSYIRPSTPTNRSSGTTRPSTPSARPTVSRSTTPSKSRTAPTASSVDKPRPSQNSRPSTPTSRTVVSANTNSSAAWTTSRPSTPTRRNSAPSLSLVSGASVPGVNSHTNGRNVGSVSRPSSPASRVRPPPQAIILPDFPLETPPNLRTTLTERSISAGRSRPGAATASKGNVEPLANSVSVPRRQPSPVVTRGRAADPIGRGRPLVNGQLSNSMDYRRELSTRKPVSTSTDGTGFGRTVSKKTSDIAARHMDIKNSRPLAASNLFPQSIRSSNHKTQVVAASGNGCMPISRYGDIAENGNHINTFSESGSEEDRHPSSAKLANGDIYESSRYDMILLKEDLKNMNWLHNIDDKSDEGSIFDNGFERLPEPFEQE